MPFINLDQRFPGIVSLFMFDRGVAKHLSKMAQDMMRRKPVLHGPHRTSLTPADRELIAAYVSKRNGCEFCYRSHQACTEALNLKHRGMGALKNVKHVIDTGDTSVIGPKMQALLALTEPVRKLDRKKIPAAIAEAKAHGASDQDIHDTVFITAFFNMCNRYVDGLGTTFEPGQEIKGGQGLAEYGYMMTIKRFFKEVLPTLLSGKRPISDIGAVR